MSQAALVKELREKHPKIWKRLSMEQRREVFTKCLDGMKVEKAFREVRKCGSQQKSS